MVVLLVVHTSHLQTSDVHHLEMARAQLDVDCIQHPDGNERRPLDPGLFDRVRVQTVNRRDTDASQSFAFVFEPVKQDVNIPDQEKECVPLLKKRSSNHRYGVGFLHRKGGINTIKFLKRKKKRQPSFTLSVSDKTKDSMRSSSLLVRRSLMPVRPQSTLARVVKSKSTLSPTSR